MDRDNKNYIEGINPLRFFAAFGIIGYHSTLGRTERFPDFLRLFIHNLPICVDFFFIISGFLITFLLLKEKERQQNISTWKFYFRRALRIFPLYYIVIGIAYLENNAIAEIAGFNKYLFLAGNFSMIENNQWPDLILSPLWSICIEEHFYLFAPILLSMLPNKHISKAFLAVIVFSILFRIYAFGMDVSWMYLYCHTLSRLDVIAIGGLLGYLYFKQQLNFKSPPFLSLLIIVGIIVLMGTIDFSDFTTIVDVAVKRYFIVIPFAILFALVVVSLKTDFLFKRISDNSILNYLGKISYGLYMYHMIVISLLSRTEFFKHSPILSFVFIVTITCFISSISFELIEKPILRLRNQFKPYG